ncbi:MAG: PIN domain-containing protein [Caulobacteraceae bacterium]
MTSTSNSLLDTNVLSEYRQPRPGAGVIAFLRQLDSRSVFLSVVTLSEIRFGIERLPAGVRRRQLDHWLNWDLPLDFRDRILVISDPVADAAGRIRARAMSAARPMGVMDAFIAATAEFHGLTLVTRNIRDFEVWGGPLLSPWSAD